MHMSISFLHNIHAAFSIYELFMICKHTRIYHILNTWGIIAQPTIRLLSVGVFVRWIF